MVLSDRLTTLLVRWEFLGSPNHLPGKDSEMESKSMLLPLLQGQACLLQLWRRKHLMDLDQSTYLLLWRSFAMSTARTVVKSSKLVEGILASLDSNVQWASTLLQTIWTFSQQRPFLKGGLTWVFLKQAKLFLWIEICSLKVEKTLSTLLGSILESILNTSEVLLA